MSTGLRGLDHLLGGVLAGDNIVWQVDTIDDFRPFVAPYCEAARRSGRKLIYFRFSSAPPLTDESSGAEVHTFALDEGFESFLFRVHRIIGETGRGAYYLFDCLSELAQSWYSDQMLANFFLLTCPYLFDLETLACFPLMRGQHSYYATAPITDTTQLFLDVHRFEGDLYVRPIKVQHRYSSTMYLLHAWRGEEFQPVTSSMVITEILANVPRPELESGDAHLDIWRRTFARAERLELARQRGESVVAEDYNRQFERLLQMAISRDERILRLCRRYLTMADALAVGKRMIGTGLVGGKSVGMLLARAILRQNSERWEHCLEKHDSFFVASDVFYTYLIRNGCWWVRESQRNPDTFLKGAPEARRQILRGTFPDYLTKLFSDMLDYYGQSPIIVRSSSLLEDNFGNAFAGKYESVFCANQGPRSKRLADFLSAVRSIYTSTMSEEALRYRARRGLLDLDEQMALLVQRVSGAQHGNLFFPEAAGVGFSFNPYVWDEGIDAKAGVVRLVFGLGTRAVDRSDDDYTRVVALNAPMRRPEENRDRVNLYAQHKVDVLGLEANQLMALPFEDVAAQSPDLAVERFATRDRTADRAARESGRPAPPAAWTLTLDGVLADTSLVPDLRDMLALLHAAYEYPVDVEFTANFTDHGECRINLVQCRPLQVHGGGAIADPPADIAPENVVLAGGGPIVGQSRRVRVDRIVYVVPEVYGVLPNQTRYGVARLIGEINRLEAAGAAGPGDRTVVFIGPGRWGTTTPSLGVPVSFAEINKASVLCEIVAMRDGIVPDVSLGTHFFSDIVEMDMLYMAYFPEREQHVFNHDYFRRAPNLLRALLPDVPEEMANIVRVIDPGAATGAMTAAALAAATTAGGLTVSLPTPASATASPPPFDGRPLIFNANTLKQRVVCYLEPVEG